MKIYLVIFEFDVVINVFKEVEVHLFTIIQLTIIVVELTPTTVQLLVGGYIYIYF